MAEQTAFSLDGLAELAQSNNYEAIRSALNGVIAKLEQPGISLQESVRAYEIGRSLADRCQTLLDEAELRITQLDSIAESEA